MRDPIDVSQEMKDAGLCYRPPDPNDPKYIKAKHLCNAFDLDANTETSCGNLELVIQCRDCAALFQLNPESIAMAMIIQASIWDYYKYVASSHCTKCKEKNEH